MCSFYHYSIENSKLMVPLFSGHYTLIGHIFGNNHEAYGNQLINDSHVYNFSLVKSLYTPNNSSVLIEINVSHIEWLEKADFKINYYDF